MLKMPEISAGRHNSLLCETADKLLDTLKSADAEPNGASLDFTLQGGAVMAPPFYWEIKMCAISQSYLKSILHYCPETGEFTWLVNRGQSVLAGDRAGSSAGDYVRISINGALYKGHRLAFMYMTGAWPVNMVDHVDGQGANNRWANLRQATSAENGQNLSRRSCGKSGYRGVSWHKGNGSWQASIKLDGIGRWLGYYVRPEDAHHAYLDAKSKLHTFNPIARQ